VLALTKCDLLEGGVGAAGAELLELHAKVVPISSVTREGLDTLVATLQGTLG
jgi:hypothetical protein